MYGAICGGAKRKEEFGRNIVAPVFFNSVLGGWKVDVYCTTTRLKPTIFHVWGNFPKVFGDKLSTLRIFSFGVKHNRLCSFWKNGMFIAAGVSAAAQAHNISFPFTPSGAPWSPKQFLLALNSIWMQFFANLQCCSIKGERQERGVIIPDLFHLHPTLASNMKKN